MSHIDIISNLTSHIRNGQREKLFVIKMKPTRTVISILSILHDQGYIRGYRLTQGKVDILLRYLNEKPAIGIFKRISKPSKRIFYDLHAISLFLKGGFMQGTLILSTPKGILSASSAQKLKVGGEVLALVHGPA